MKRYCGIMALVFCFFSVNLVLSAGVLYVSPEGNDENPGTLEKPLASVSKALVLLEKAQPPLEIILKGGLYRGTVAVNQPKGAENMEIPPLTIKALDGSKVIFDGGMLVSNAAPMEGSPNLFVLNGKFTRLPDMWEEDTRIRYTPAADISSVRAFPATFFRPDENTLVFQTSDGKTPAVHQLITSLHYEGFQVYRDNVTIRGIDFVNYLGYRWAAAITIRGKNCRVDSCTARNCYRGFTAAKTAANTVFTNIATWDVGGGIYTQGTNTTVEHCFLTKTRDSFMIEMYDQDDTGIQFYAPASGGTCRYNLCRGFERGIFVKAQSARYLLEHNTLVDGVDMGMYNNGWNPEVSYRQNIICGYKYALYAPQKVVAGATFDENVIWDPIQLRQNWDAVTVPRHAGTGRLNVMADPLFAAPGKDDYRPLRESIAVKLGDSAGPVGAFPAVPGDYRDISPPTLAIVPQDPVRPDGLSGKLFFDRDPWIGGGRDFIRDLGPEKTSLYVSPNRTFKILLDARHPTQKIMKMKVSYEGSNNTETAFSPYCTVTLPDKDGRYTISACVMNEEGAWSKLSSVDITLARQPPLLEGEPRVIASRHGAIVTCATKTPSLVRLHFSRDGKKWETVDPYPLVTRVWSAANGGDDTEEIFLSGKTHAIPLIYPLVAPATVYRYKIVISDIVGNETESQEYTFETKGDPTTLFVSPEGNDAGMSGSREKPCRTIQHALDRALPGDTVLILPGVYSGSAALRHGGVEGAPITIMAEKPRTVILDGNRKETMLFRLEKAPDVVIKNLELRWFGRYGIYAYQSPRVSVEGCYIWNDHFEGNWPTGYGIFFDESPFCSVSRNIVFIMEDSIFFLSSPEARVTHNTCTGNMYAGLSLVWSCRNSVVRNNAFCFAGNDNFALEDQENAFPSLTMDYNNYAARIWDDRPVKPENNIKPKHPYLRGNKAIVNINNKRSYTLEDWQKASGKDAHSIYKDPLWVNPKGHDFSLEKGSPCVGAGEGGKTIGATDVGLPFGKAD